MRIKPALFMLPLLAVLIGCSNDEPALATPALPATGSSAIPAPPAAPDVPPVDAVAVQSELVRAVSAMEEHRKAEGVYTQSPAALEDHGFVSSKVLIVVPYADEDRYCIEVTSSTDPRLVLAASDSAPAPRQGGYAG